MKKLISKPLVDALVLMLDGMRGIFYHIDVKTNSVMFQVESHSGPLVYMTVKPDVVTVETLTLKLGKETRTRSAVAVIKTMIEQELLSAR